jgi:hypothetical protein
VKLWRQGDCRVKFSVVVAVRFSFRANGTKKSGNAYQLPAPFPLNIFAANGLRIGELYLGNCVSFGEAHGIICLSSQSVSLDFGCALGFLGVIPFLHSFDTYITLLLEDQQRWQGFWRPIRDILGVFIRGLLQDHRAEMQAYFQEEI